MTIEDYNPDIDVVEQFTGIKDPEQAKKMLGEITDTDFLSVQLLKTKVPPKLEAVNRLREIYQKCNETDRKIDPEVLNLIAERADKIFQALRTSHIKQV